MFIGSADVDVARLTAFCVQTKLWVHVRQLRKYNARRVSQFRDLDLVYLQ